MTKKKMVSRVIQVAYHRNGVAGAGFHAVMFETSTDRCAGCRGFATLGYNASGAVCVSCGMNKPAKVESVASTMVAAVFDEPGYVAVLGVAPLSDPEVGVAFGENSWRGDQYESELRAAIASHQSDGSERVGPFAIPTRRMR